MSAVIIVCGRQVMYVSALVMESSCVWCNKVVSRGGMYMLTMWMCLFKVRCILISCSSIGVVSGVDSWKKAMSFLT